MARTKGKGQKLDKYYRFLNNINITNPTTADQQKVPMLEKYIEDVKKYIPTSDYEKKDKNNLLWQLNITLRELKVNLEYLKNPTIKYHESTIKMSLEELKKINEIIESSDCHQSQRISFDFDNGFFADLNIVWNDSRHQIEPILFNSNGDEEDSMMPQNWLKNEYIFLANNELYICHLERLKEEPKASQSTSYSVVIVNDNETSNCPSVFRSKQEIIKAIKNKYEKELWNHIKSSNSDLPFSNRLNCSFSVYQSNGELVYEHYYDVISKKHYQVNKLF